MYVFLVLEGELSKEEGERGMEGGMGVRDVSAYAD